MATSEETTGSAKRPWTKGEGWEYDLLRTLPPERADEVWVRAFARGLRRLFTTWWVWSLLPFAALPFAAYAVLIWMLAAFLGLGLLGRIALEIGLHLVLGYFLLPPLERVIRRSLRPFVREELTRFAQEQCPADRPQEGE